MGNSESSIVVDNILPDDFEWNHPVLRRGGVIRLSFNGESLLESLAGGEKIRILMTVNDCSVKDTEISYLEENPSKSKWNFKLVSEEGDNPVYHLESPYDCEIGEYKLRIQCGEKLLESKTFLMLFNAWNPNDEAYMPDEEERNEYILNTQTILFQGYSTYMNKQTWNLDQFGGPTVALLLHLLKRMDRPLRSSFTKFARELTALVNNFDDNGILAGRWDGEYYGGKPPHYWSGSREIFRKYLKHRKTVKYGQCFTFAAILFFRLAGIGSRIVTCFECLHDSDGTLDKEVYYDANNNIIENLTKDSIWNFHCWTECYMRFAEDEKYNGWQVCDATPQEPSEDGRYVCGPAPVAAVKAGDLKVGHDCRYVFSEVNGDVVYKRITYGAAEVVGVDFSKVGQKISTKAVGSNERNDVTDNYKYDGGSLLDVMARKNADNSLCDRICKRKIVKFRTTTNSKDHMIMNEDLDLIINLLYVSYSTVDVVIKCFLLQQPNIRSKEISHKKLNVFADGRNTEISFHVASKDILSRIESDLVAVLVEVFVVDGDKLSRQDFCLPITTPSFSITAKSEDLKFSETHDICVHMENPFVNDMQNVNVRLETDFTDEKHKKKIEKVGRGEAIDVVFNVMPIKKGCFEVRAIIYGNKMPTFREVRSINIV